MRTADTGLRFALASEQLLVERVMPGSTAEKAGIRAGWSVEGIDDSDVKAALKAMLELDGNARRQSEAILLSRANKQVMGIAADSRVALRPEPFGALAYHYGNRRLTFLRSPDLVALVEHLADQPSARAAFDAAGIESRRWPSFEKALASLAAGDFLVDADDTDPSATDPTAEGSP